MNEKVNIQKVSSIIGSILNEKLSNESNMTNTENWDSMAQMQIMLELEKQFGIEFDLMNLAKAISVKGWYQAIKEEAIKE